MKKTYFYVVLLIFLFFLDSTLWAQKGIGFKGGINISKNHVSGGNDGISPIVGGNIGVLGYMSFTGYLKGQIELQYSLKGYKVENAFEDEFSSTDLKIMSHYLDVPILAKLYPFHSGLNFTLGPNLGFLLKRKILFSEKKFDNQERSKNQIFDIGINFGCGYEMKNGLFLDLRYIWGLSSTYRELTDFQNRTFQFSVGYNFYVE